VNPIQPGLFDHLLVLIVMVLVFPFVGWWNYQRLLAREKIEGEHALVRKYQLTIL